LKDFIFEEDEPRDSAAFEFEPSLFHHLSHLKLQRNADWRWYYITDPKRKKIFGSLYMNIGSSGVTSAVRSPFGTVECVSDIPAEVLYDFIVFVEGSMRKLGTSTITIKNPPYAYAPRNMALLSTFLPNLGYAIEAAEISACVAVNEPFDRKINNMQKQVLQKAHQKGLQYKVIPIELLKEVYQFIERCHEEKGYQLSMNYSDLLEAVQKLPHRYLLSGVFLNGVMVASSVAVQVYGALLYNFYMAHDPAYSKFSPAISLIEGLYQYCIENEMSLLDLGTSALNGQPNFSLLDFKLRLGATLTPKITFKKVLVHG
jgi:hypothetical protein